MTKQSGVDGFYEMRDRNVFMKVLDRLMKHFASHERKSLLFDT